MKSDSELRRDVESELAWEPSIDERYIGVSVTDGVVTLVGAVKSYAEQWKVERAAERVTGVKGVANDIEVQTRAERSDTDIAQAAVKALELNVLVPPDRVKVEVTKGRLTLTGEVDGDYQRRAAEAAVRYLPDVSEITDEITIATRVQPEAIKEQIKETFQRVANVDAKRVTVEASGDEVTLRGTVRSWAERHEAEKVAWAAPGVATVQNHITVDQGVA